MLFSKWNANKTRNINIRTIINCPIIDISKLINIDNSQLRSFSRKQDISRLNDLFYLNIIFLISFAKVDFTCLALLWIVLSETNVTVTVVGYNMFISCYQDKNILLIIYNNNAAKHRIRYGESYFWQRLILRPFARVGKPSSPV